ncbi:HEPN domain-containing protein [Telluribacter sp. SYSU D00476]|uniref:HEPN domain-containing protein n=1 Tax=Telluribacter sp. SYSU D00476 TaxID=2811430 RepID=UPI001FF5CC4C|nr:HEPN domain-containing protein [Telluribacter sp. SYSU D00476]
MKELVQKGIAQAHEDLAAAQVLISAGFYGASINRAYYAMFNLTRTLLHLKGVHAKTHQGAISKFNELYVKSGLLPIELSKKLSRTEELREAADYDLDSHSSKEEAAQAIEDATSFMAEVTQYLRIQNIT